MSTLNPFDLLDNDAEDVSQLVAAKPVKVVKPAPVQPVKSSQAVREVKNGSYGGRGGDGSGRGGGGGYNRESRSNDAPANGNGGARRGGGYRRERSGGSNSVDLEGFERPRRNYARHSGTANGDSGDFERPRRNYEVHSGTGHGNEFKRDGAGRGNWGTKKSEVSPVTEESTAVAEKDLAVEKQVGVGEGEATDANKETPVIETPVIETPVKETPVKEQVAREPEMKVITLEEYEKVLEEKKKALQTTKADERKVDTKAFDAMQQLSSKKSNNDEVFIKLGTEKDKRVTEREEKAKKSVSINEFLKPANGARRGGYRGGRGPREGGGNQRRYGGAAAPAIEDTAQFPTLGK
ncbi:unnamed protein product [Cochlearia groenlandica]